MELYEFSLDGSFSPIGLDAAIRLQVLSEIMETQRRIDAERAAAAAAAAAAAEKLHQEQQRLAAQQRAKFESDSYLQLAHLEQHRQQFITGTEAAGKRVVTEWHRPLAVVRLIACGFFGVMFLAVGLTSPLDNELDVPARIFSTIAGPCIGVLLFYTASRAYKYIKNTTTLPEWLR